MGVIRAAWAADVPALLELGRRFHGWSHWNGVVAFDEVRTEASLRAWIAEPEVGVFVSDPVRDVLALILSPIYFSAEPVALEIAFWARGGRGDALRRAGE